MNDIVEQLRALASYKHDDLSIGNDAADEIESLRQRVKESEGYEQECAILDVSLPGWEYRTMRSRRRF